ncbi:MAG: ubiquinone/menaquinone biosynthesis C-methylase UbiE [Crocinitomix sp.]|jgi:ubiquinone/menaquinone biosynthesis C-methylase UbiE
MRQEENYLAINKASWNNRTDSHLASEFYNVEGFLKGQSSLNSIELDLLGDVKGKKILHLQCHFGQDSLSLARMGAKVTGVDLSDKAINAGKELARKMDLDVQFIACDVYDLPQYLEDQFDIVFTSYGTIGWLPDMNKWADLIARYLKPGGHFVFAEFHPVVWMFDDDFKTIKFNYSNAGPIKENEEGTYADKTANIKQDYVMWNHGLAEVVSALLSKNISIQKLQEFDYSPYDCFDHTVEFEPGKYRIKHLDDKIPMVYALLGKKEE